MKQIISIVTAVWLLNVSGTSIAGDIAREIQLGDSDNGGFAELGIVFQTARLPLLGFTDQEPEGSRDTLNSLNIGIQGRLAFKGFFAEVIEDSFSDITLGYSVKNTDSYSLDFIASSSFNDIERNGYSGYESIEDREGDISLGFRSSFYNGDDIFQYELVSDAAGSHGGVMASVQYGRQYQLRNWNLHTLLGVRYFSEKVVDHYFGVTAAESTETLPEYSAKQGLMPTVLFGATLPLNEKWVFRAHSEYSYLPDSVSNSPLAQGDDFYIVQAGVYRVLYPR